MRSKYLTRLVSVVLLGMAMPFLMTQVAHAEYQGSSVDEVWEQVSSDPYNRLPQTRVTFWSFFSGFRDILLKASKRTLSNDEDTLPYFKKLLHPNGICLKGTWNITEETDYTGAFSTGTQMPIIARASTALSNTKTGQNRAFSLAGKLFPTTEGETHTPVKTGNFFTIEDLGGNYKRYFLDAQNGNDILKVTPSLTIFLNSILGVIVGKDFAIADRSTPQTTLIRELYPISELGLSSAEEAITPIWMNIDGSQDVPRIDATDFRHELNVENYPEGLRFDITVASKGFRLGWKDWQKIGYIEFEESVTSASCDHRIHFAHPKSRKVYLGL